MCPSWVQVCLQEACGDADGWGGWRTAGTHLARGMPLWGLRGSPKPPLTFPGWRRFRCFRATSLSPVPAPGGLGGWGFAASAAPCPALGKQWRLRGVGVMSRRLFPDPSQ